MPERSVARAQDGGSGDRMRIEASVTSVSWIPSELVDGMPKIAFGLGLTSYDEPLPDRRGDLEE